MPLAPEPSLQTPLLILLTPAIREGFGAKRTAFAEPDDLFP